MLCPVKVTVIFIWSLIDSRVLPLSLTGVINSKKIQERSIKN
jgi:hypothetical protein